LSPSLFFLQIKVDIKRKYLKVIIENKTIIDGELEHEIKTDEATWSLEKGKSLCISLTKATEHWWKKLTEDEGKKLPRPNF